MGMTVDHGVRQDLPSLSMNNGLMSAFIGVLTIALSSLAKSVNEKRIAVWVASHDQRIFGSGVVDFDVCDVPWSVKTFDADKTFMLQAIQAAASKFEWQKLGYSPREDWVLESLRSFQGLVEHFLVEHVLSHVQWTWQFGEEPAGFLQCAKHGVYLHSHGCVLCNDA